MHYKDEVLNNISLQGANVAQFVSFCPNLQQRYSRVRDFSPNHHFESLDKAIEVLLTKSNDSSVNIRSYDPQDPTNPHRREFLRELKTVDIVKSNIKRLAFDEKLYTIVNESININDGGVSGVVLGDILEFSPGATPRCVDSDIPNTIAKLPRKIGIQLLQVVYGFIPALEKYPLNKRVEFSIHPLRQGYNYDHTIIWEINERELFSQAMIHWPNNFSRLIGDKAFGLIVADLLGFPVPKTTVISRGISPFTFGQSTTTSETWIRTCPKVQMPGRFSTFRGWRDPFKIMSDEDPKGEFIASIIAQSEIDAEFSGALVDKEDGEEPIIEGVNGFGDQFMIGGKNRNTLPNKLISQIRVLHAEIVKKIGPIRMEWVADSQKVWIVQLHCGARRSSNNIIYPGNANYWHRFNTKDGLEGLRKLISSLRRDEGVILQNVGITSHFGDTLYNAKIPSKIEFSDEL